MACRACTCSVIFRSRWITVVHAGSRQVTLYNAESQCTAMKSYKIKPTHQESREDDVPTSWEIGTLLCLQSSQTTTTIFKYVDPSRFVRAAATNQSQSKAGSLKKRMWATKWQVRFQTHVHIWSQIPWNPE
ncbi:hypothetical protein F5887DRAFT_924144 [Amanita rubescens]|nr:hypothetical protein F5887DRAFT_924144 [Amanita rubescens]